MLLWREMEHEVGDSGLEPSRLPHLRVLQQWWWVVFVMLVVLVLWVGVAGLVLPWLSPAGECWTLTTVRKVTQFLSIDVLNLKRCKPNIIIINTNENVVIYKQLGETLQVTLANHASTRHSYPSPPHRTRHFSMKFAKNHHLDLIHIYSILYLIRQMKWAVIESSKNVTNRKDRVISK